MSKTTTINATICFLIVSLFAFLFGCGGHQINSKERKFKTLFDGYQLILVGDLPEGDLGPDFQPLMIQGKYPLEPEVLTPQRIYVFRKTNTLSNETLALKILPGRISAIGGQILRAPLSNRDLMYPYFGVPLFTISFKMDGHEGKLFNRPAPSPANNKDGQELLVLTYK
ncbi:MAG: hypothetical protein WA581_17465 [Candidatus Acidiferrales bacterium]